jgi:hypothetical protein
MPLLLVSSRVQQNGIPSWVEAAGGADRLKAPQAVKTMVVWACCYLVPYLYVDGQLVVVLNLGLQVPLLLLALELLHLALNVAQHRLQCQHQHKATKTSSSGNATNSVCCAATECHKHLGCMGCCCCSRQQLQVLSRIW